MTNNIFAHNGDTDSIMATPALDARDALAATVITGNIFYDNKVPLGINVTYSMDDSNTFDNAAAAPLNAQPNKYNAIFVKDSGVMASATTWSAIKVPFVLESYIDVQAALTLQPGLIIKFKQGGYLSVGTSGTVNADAASASTPIIFTSIKDDTQGGDTNGDGSATAPLAGDWIRVNFWSGGVGSKFNYCRFYYGGGTSDDAVLDLRAYSATVTNNIFAHNGTTDSITATPALDARDALAATVITGNIFYDNMAPLGINVTYSMDDSNTFDNAAAAPLNAQPNKYNAIFVKDSGVMASATTWSAIKVPFVLENWIKVQAALTFADNVVVKFKVNGYFSVSSSGSLNNANGTSVQFTSIKDDTYLGDTNGDGSATIPAKGDWSGIIYSIGPAPAPAYSTDTRYADWTNILYATETSHTP